MRKHTAPSPAMKQYLLAKEKYPDTIVFFRMGDFYEMFFEDALLASQLLEIALTSRGTDQDGKAIPMAGVPHHSASGYIARLLEKGKRVAICEQMEDPSTTKGIVRREVVRVVTPGLVADTDALDARVHNYLVGVVEHKGEYGLAAFEFTTAEIRACTLVERADLLAELVRLDPREVLLQDQLDGIDRELDSVLTQAVVRTVVKQQIKAAVEDDSIREIVGRANIEEGSGTMGVAGTHAAAVVLHYAKATQLGISSLGVRRVTSYDTKNQLVLDETAIRNLEVVQTFSGERRGSLIHLIDVTKTAMGARTLRRRLISPLCDVPAIRRRHDCVESMVRDSLIRGRIGKVCAEIGDLERLATRASLGVATPREMGAIRESLRGTAHLMCLVKEMQEHTTDEVFSSHLAVDKCSDLFEILEKALHENPPVTTNNGWIFADSYHTKIAELRSLSASSKDVILRIEEQERARTGISSLRIRYTRVFGYYIEVTKSNLAAVPNDYRRKQTVATGERFTTEELETLQAEILSADERLNALEAELFEELRKKIGGEASRLRELAKKIADLDAHAAFAEIADRFDYVRPTVDGSLGLDFKNLRHPIVEQTLARGEFVPNDIRLDVEDHRLMIITGPNMAGKSTVMRQVALAVIIAQAGGFVPASAARIGVVDRIYTRVGATDAVARGMSTFMVEMRETASILQGATSRSLVILDEIGRGTSTYDGLAIAWAVTEHLYDAIGCRSLFATHYHELCELAATREGIVNYNVAAKEYGNDVLFLHKLVPGGANRSYGIAVANLAGIPKTVVRRAREILKDLEHGSLLPSGLQASVRAKNEKGAIQLDMFAPTTRSAHPSELEKAFSELEIEGMTPLEALIELARLKKMLMDKENDG